MGRLSVACIMQLGINYIVCELIIAVVYRQGVGSTRFKYLKAGECGTEAELRPKVKTGG